MIYAVDDDENGNALTKMGAPASFRMEITFRTESSSPVLCSPRSSMTFGPGLHGIYLRERMGSDENPWKSMQIKEKGLKTMNINEKP